MEVEATSYEDWFQKVSATWMYNRWNIVERWGQFLYNRMPDRFCNRVPTGFDPFYNDDNVENFLWWLKNHWDT